MESFNESIDLLSDKNELNINQQLLRQRDKLMKRQQDMKNKEDINDEFELLQINLKKRVKQKEKDNNSGEESKSIQPVSSYCNEYENIGKLIFFNRK